MTQHGYRRAVQAGRDSVIRLWQSSTAELQLWLSQGLPSPRVLTRWCAVDSIHAVDASGMGAIVAHLSAGGLGVDFSPAMAVLFVNAGAVGLSAARGNDGKIRACRSRSDRGEVQRLAARKKR